ncbi:hypothetical protein BH10BAC5_BH10BAC5_23310 [soil metagenome]
MKKLILTVFAIICIPSLVFSQLDDAAIESKANEIGVKPEMLKRVVRNIQTQIRGDDPHPESMNVLTLSSLAGSNFGNAVSSAGDVNGDGNADIIIGAFGAGGSTGKAYIYYGGNSMSNSPDVILSGESDGTFGTSVSSAGDVNGDGYSDVIVGAPNNAAGVGRVYIYFGGPSMNNVPDVIMDGEGLLSNFGSCVSGAGDLNGDGYCDVVAGAYGYSSSTGRAYIYYGGAAMNNIADVVLNGESANNQFGFSLSFAGDVNGDGYDDIIVGAKLGASNFGRAYIYFGGSIMNNTEDVILTGESAFSSFGYSVSSAGDVNGDGFSDVIVGAINQNGNFGKAYLYYGSSSMDNIYDLAFNEDSFSYFGNSVHSAGDVNADGYSDIVIGAFWYSSNLGRVYIYYGGSVPDNVPDVVLTGDSPSSGFGVSVASAGDLNNDGIDDLIIGNVLSKAFVYKNSLTGTDIADLNFIGEAGGNQFGVWCSNAGDVNGDGFDDLIVGSPFYNNIGKAYLYYGGITMDVIPDVVFNGESAGNIFGNSVTGGDLNADGYSDIIVSAPGYNSNTGKVYIYYGAASMDNVPDITMLGVAVNNYFGFPLSCGDINGDGYSDLLTGMSGYNSNLGRVLIYYGGSAMDNIADLTLTGEGAANYFGISAAITGDVNGDNYADIVVGAPHYNSNTGKAYIFFGGSIPNNTPDVTYTGQSTTDYFANTVSDAGDVNNDGFNDVLISNTKNNAFLCYGGQIFNTVTDVTFSLNYGVKFGFTLAKAGDVNGDGYDDICIGDPDGNSYAGKIYLYFGGSTIHTIPDIVMSGENSDKLGSFITSGDFNGDGFSDIAAGSQYYNSNVGKAGVFFSNPPAIKPSLFSISDIPNDQGGKVLLRWSRSAYQQTGLVTSYDIYRSPKPVGGTYSWQLLANLPVGVNKIYSYNADTYSDSVTAGIQKSYYKITARTSVLSQNWSSNIQSGYSVDNLAPSAPSSLTAIAGSSKIDLDWNDAYAPDLAFYNIYRNGAIYTTSISSLITDNSVNANSDYTYIVSAVDIHGNESELSNSVTASIAIKISLKLYLEGAYTFGQNSTNLVSANLIPLASPYLTGETITNSFLASQTQICDWIKIDLRQTQSGSTVSSRSVFLLSDGSLLDTNLNSFCSFYGVAAGNYYVVVSHRNHLSVMTASFNALSSINVYYDLTTGLNKYFGNDAKDLSGGIFGMYSGDGNQDGSVDNTDRNLVWRPNNGIAGYLAGDFNLDGAVDNIDKNRNWRSNNGKATWVP